MHNKRILKLASEVRYSISEIIDLQVLGNLTDDETEKIVMASHEAKHESLLPLKDLIVRGVNIH